MSIDRTLIRARVCSLIRSGLLILGIFLFFSLANAQKQPAQRRSQQEGSKQSADLPPAAAASLESGTAAMHSGAPDKAVSFFRQLTAQAPRFAAGYLNLAIAEQQLGDEESARRAAATAAALAPLLRGPHFILGLALYQLDSFDDAVTAFRGETKLNPEDANAWMWAGVADLAAGHNGRAVDELSKARGLQPDNADVLYHLGRAYILLSKESYDAMYRIDPDSSRVHETLAQSNAEAGKTDEAIAEFRVAIAKAPSEPGLREELADELWKSEKLDEADREYAEALRTSPHDAVLLYKKGSLEVSRHHSEDGVPLLKRALEFAPAMGEVYFQLGLGESQLDQDEAALDHLSRAIDTDPNSDDKEAALYHMFQVQRKLGRGEEAKRSLAAFQRVKAENAAKRQERIEAKRRRASLPVPTQMPAEESGAESTSSAVP